MRCRAALATSTVRWRPAGTSGRRLNRSRPPRPRRRRIHADARSDTDADGGSHAGARCDARGDRYPRAGPDGHACADRDGRSDGHARPDVDSSTDRHASSDPETDTDATAVDRAASTRGDQGRRGTRGAPCDLGPVSREMPRPYRDGCHWAQPLSTRCYYGNVRSKTTIVLFGDSHALAWFPAVERVAKDRGWRLINVTRSACPPAKLRSYSRATHEILRSCISWRARYRADTRPSPEGRAGDRVARVHRRRRRWPDPDRARPNRGVEAWHELDAGQAGAEGRPGDRPGRHAELALRQPGALPRSNPRHTIRCATTVSKAISYAWLNIEAAAARTGHAGFIDTEMWVCPTTPCPAIVWGRLVHRNRGHLSVSFPRTQWARLKRAILREARLISRRAGRRPLASARWSVGRTGPASGR